VTRIEWDGTMQRRMVDTAQRSDGRQWEDLAARALALLPLYRPVPRVPIYHVKVDDQVVQAAERDLAGALRDLQKVTLNLVGHAPGSPTRRGLSGYGDQR